jgi:hypothetical protein
LTNEFEADVVEAYGLLFEGESKAELGKGEVIVTVGANSSKPELDGKVHSWEIRAEEATFEILDYSISLGQLTEEFTNMTSELRPCETDATKELIVLKPTANSHHIKRLGQSPFVNAELNGGVGTIEQKD